jgi:hypothetical protein
MLKYIELLMFLSNLNDNDKTNNNNLKIELFNSILTYNAMRWCLNPTLNFIYDFCYNL